MWRWAVSTPPPKLTTRPELGGAHIVAKIASIVLRREPERGEYAQTGRVMRHTCLRNGTHILRIARQLENMACATADLEGDRPGERIYQSRPEGLAQFRPRNAQFATIPACRLLERETRAVR